MSKWEGKLFITALLHIHTLTYIDLSPLLVYLFFNFWEQQAVVLQVRKTINEELENPLSTGYDSLLLHGATSLKRKTQTKPQFVLFSPNGSFAHWHKCDRAGKYWDQQGTITRKTIDWTVAVLNQKEALDDRLYWNDLFHVYKQKPDKSSLTIGTKL